MGFNDDPRWTSMDDAHKAALMALMERNNRGRGDWKEGLDAAGAMVNRARLEGRSLGASVSNAHYQPWIEPAQKARMGSLLQNPDFEPLAAKVKQMQEGNAPTGEIGNDTHFLAPEGSMLALQARNPAKYSGWKGWTGYGQDPAHPGYSNPDLQPVNRTRDHVYLAPDGRPALQKLNLLGGPQTPPETPPSPFASPQGQGPISSVPPTGEAPMAGAGYNKDPAPISPGLEMAANPPGGYFGDPTNISGWNRGATTPMPGTTVLGPDNDSDVTPKVDDTSPMERFVPGYEPITPSSTAPDPEVVSAAPSQPPSQSRSLKQQAQDLLPDWLKSGTAKDAVKAATTPGPGGGPTPLAQALSPFTKPGGGDLHANAVAAAQKGSMGAVNKGGQKPTLSDALNRYAMAGISSPLPSQTQPRKPVPIYG